MRFDFDMWCWLVSHADTVRNIILFVGLIGGLIGLCFAGWRCLIAYKNLQREKCQMGLELLSLHQERYTARVAGAAILADILNSKTIEYDEAILRTFEAYLASPSVFSKSVAGHMSGDTDYESRETVLVVNALRQYRYRKGLGALHMLSLPPKLAFTITGDTVKPNEEHEHYRRWLEVRGRPPKYPD